ncbi:MAG: ParA family protein [Actinomycetales bacterium]
MLIVSVCSLKGGVGKTSITLGLASSAMARDVRTLVVDLDPQADATTGLDVVSAPKHDLADVLQKPKRSVIEDALAPSGWTADSPGRVDVLVGSHRLAALDALRSDGSVEPKLAAALPTALGKLSTRYDLMLLDCPPNLAALTRTGLAASQRALIVGEPGLFSVAAADRALKAVEDVRRHGAKDLQPLGIVVNRFRARRREHAYRVTEMRALFGPLVLSPVIDERSVLQQAQGAGRAIHDWPTAPGKQMAGTFDKLLDRVLRAAPKRKK